MDLKLADYTTETEQTDAAYELLLHQSIEARPEYVLNHLRQPSTAQA